VEESRILTTRETKSEKTKKIDEFWNWFIGIAETLATNIENISLTKELDDRMRNLDSELSWELGPGISKPWQLVISPGLKRNLRERARGIVSCAPSVTAWEFYSAKPPKTWDYILELENAEGGRVRLDASNWTFVLLRYPDGTHEILLKGSDLPALTEDERWQAAAITLESILGEDLILDRINEFELVDKIESRFAKRQRPIQELRQAITSN
jgi:hypothetical protein